MQRLTSAISLREARTLIPALLRMTAAAAVRVERILSRAEDDPDARLAGSIEAIFEVWSDAIELLGARPAGLWRVEFDNGDGYYCWHWPEDDLVRYRPYGDEGMHSQPIQ